MSEQLLKNINAHYKILKGNKGKRYYAISQELWDYIQSEFTIKKYETKRQFVRNLSNLTNNDIPYRTINSWISYRRKPILIDNFMTMKNSNTSCNHGVNCYYSICNLHKSKTQNCPVPLLWVTDSKGRIFVYQNYWDEIKYFIDNSLSFGLLPSNLSTLLSVNPKTIRHWKNNVNLPNRFTNDEFTFSKHNLYFLGLFLSDGHLRCNGSEYSYTYQVGSSDIFQGYWYPQLIQRVFPIYKHKKMFSNTYLVLDKSTNKSYFKTNLSSISPIFIQHIIKSKLIHRKNNHHTIGWQKSIPEKFLKSIKSYTEYFQGIFDGDGSYGYYTSPAMYLSTSVDINYKHLIEILPLIPTSTSINRKNVLAYHERKSNQLYFVKFAPESLKNLSNRYSADDIVNQLEFFIDSAHNSIRPDKVHKLIKIIKKITDLKYGRNTNSILLQREIQHIANKRKLRQKLRTLIKRYPIKNGNYLPFMPKWLEGLCSKYDAWNFFHKKTNLTNKTQSINIDKADFSKGIPIDFTL